MVKSLFKKGLSTTLFKKGLTENPGNNVVGVVKQADLETKGNKDTEVLSGGLISQSHVQEDISLFGRLQFFDRLGLLR
ncbi:MULTISPECIES: hypothetical protein [Methanosarcina]|uniref:Uncharacterized protein n=3 Tax=Methanosarcina barkeri TaxID=2208 RepID=A0A0E3QT81_METBA|nr:MULTISPECIES: hypothetical protein [Methanosarcina]AKB54178.1 hypothetical protein MSBRM_1180 [Methanosarcina barkeri MS]AKB57747.1 hypothetical protein MSBR2_1231 [Methanosarcina barkeri 227]AKJ38288.1 hypothetical protein MCM1_1234 [Methanosarcina barkeri CM1]OED07961.1 hypothetical protein A9239_09535 [Methanosarcina sp. A14]